MRRDLLPLGEMIEASAEAVSLVAGTDLQALAADRQRRDALLWNFTVLGEAAAQLDADIKIRFPDVPRAQPARLRNRIIHVDRPEILRNTATDLLPGFVQQLQKVLDVLEAEEHGDA